MPKTVELRLKIVELLLKGWWKTYPVNATEARTVGIIFSGIINLGIGFPLVQESTSFGVYQRRYV